MKSPENTDSARFSAISAQADLLHKTDCIQNCPMTAITAIGRKMLGTEGNSALAELGRATSSLQAVFLKVLGSKILYLSRFLRVMPLGCPLGCPREAPVLVWCLFPLGFYNIAQADCFFKRQEEEPILFGSSTGYSAFAYMLLNALFTMVDSASGLLYFTLAYMSIVILLFS